MKTKVGKGRCLAQSRHCVHVGRVGAGGGHVGRWEQRDKGVARGHDARSRTSPPRLHPAPALPAPAPPLVARSLRDAHRYSAPTSLHALVHSRSLKQHTAPGNSSPTCTPLPQPPRTSPSFNPLLPPSHRASLYDPILDAFRSRALSHQARRLTLPPLSRRRVQGHSLCVGRWCSLWLADAATSLTCTHSGEGARVRGRHGRRRGRQDCCQVGGTRSPATARGEVSQAELDHILWRTRRRRAGLRG